MSQKVCKMLSHAHCRHRAEMLRVALITTTDPIAAFRLRKFVEKYKILAQHSDRIDRLTQTVEQEILGALSRKIRAAEKPI